MARKYRCTVCGYIHEGDGPPDECPVCGAGSDVFELVDEPIGEEAARGTAEAARTRAEPAPAPTPAESSEPGWVILGGGIAALSAAEAARKASPERPIVIVHREPTLPYQRLSLTRLLAGEISRDRLVIHPSSWFEERRIDLVHAEARRIDRESHSVLLDDGSCLPYQKLLVATGAHAFVPPIPGVRRDGVHVLRTLADADAILARSASDSRVVCIGAGLLGLEAAGGLARSGIDVTVIEGADRLLPRQLAKSGAVRLTAHLASLGIHFRFGAEIQEIAGDETVHGVILADGCYLPAEVVLIAAGVRPNAEVARSAGLAVGRGLRVDDGMQTSDRDIFAAGDVTEHRGIVWGLWTVAMEQGTLAGRALAGVPVCFDGRPAPTQLKVVGMPVFSLGRFEATAPDECVIEHADESHLVRIVTKDDIVIGGNLIGDISLADNLRRAVHEGLPASALNV